MAEWSTARTSLGGAGGGAGGATVPVDLVPQDAVTTLRLDAAASAQPASAYGRWLESRGLVRSTRRCRTRGKPRWLGEER